MGVRREDRPVSRSVPPRSSGRTMETRVPGVRHPQAQVHVIGEQRVAVRRVGRRPRRSCCCPRRRSPRPARLAASTGRSAPAGSPACEDPGSPAPAWAAARRLAPRAARPTPCPRGAISSKRAGGIILCSSARSDSRPPSRRELQEHRSARRGWSPRASRGAAWCHQCHVLERLVAERGEAGVHSRGVGFEQGAVRRLRPCHDLAGDGAEAVDTMRLVEAHGAVAVRAPPARPAAWRAAGPSGRSDPGREGTRGRGRRPAAAGMERRHAQVVRSIVTAAASPASAPLAVELRQARLHPVPDPHPADQGDQHEEAEQEGEHPEGAAEAGAIGVRSMEGSVAQNEVRLSRLAPALSMTKWT